QRMAEILGYVPQEMIGRSVFDFMDAKARHEAMRIFRRRLNGIKEPGDIRFQHKNRSDVWAIVAGDPFLDENGAFTGGMAMITDISKRRRAEMETRSALLMLQSVIDSLPAYISYVDAEECYRLVNRRYEAWFQRPREEIVGHRLVEIHPP